MKKTQKCLPKYWVVHDKTTGDIFVQTMSKSMNEAENLFLHYYSFSHYGMMNDHKLLDKFYNDENLETILVEILEVVR